MDFTEFIIGAHSRDPCIRPILRTDAPAEIRPGETIRSLPMNGYQWEQVRLKCSRR